MRDAREKKKNSHETLRMHPICIPRYIYTHSLLYSISISFFFSASHLFPPSPPQIIITTLFSLRDNLRSSVEARRNVTGCFGGTRINLARRE